MTVTGEAQLEMPAWSVKAGDTVYSSEHADWKFVEEKRDESSQFGSLVVLVFSRQPRDFALHQTRDKVRVAL